VSAILLPLFSAIHFACVEHTIVRDAVLPQRNETRWIPAYEVAEKSRILHAMEVRLTSIYAPTEGQDS
jgi:hypothetical protein